ncbi:hypothetical protein TNCV_2328381 [Trichonephila clavipes]|nr:hypothetical protein TNCV_2328381 [Trichonephila clavipes]
MFLVRIGTSPWTGSWRPVEMVMSSWPACHEFDPNTSEDVNLFATKYWLTENILETGGHRQPYDAQENRVLYLFNMIGRPHGKVLMTSYRLINRVETGACMTLSERVKSFELKVLPLTWRNSLKRRCWLRCCHFHSAVVQT